MQDQDVTDACLIVLRSLRRDLAFNVIMGKQIAYIRAQYLKHLYMLTQIEAGMNWEKAEIDYNESYWVTHSRQLEAAVRKYWTE